MPEVEAQPVPEEQPAPEEEAAEEAAEVGVSGGELDLLAAIIQCEAGGESHEGKVAVGAVIMNRIQSSDFPNSISDVVLSERTVFTGCKRKVVIRSSGGAREVTVARRCAGGAERCQSGRKQPVLQQRKRQGYSDRKSAFFINH